MALHFLHIGKTGGSAVKEAIAGRPGIALHEHGARLRDIPQGEPVFFTVREPLARYVSAFNSRLRAGRPRYDVPWSPDEAKAFAAGELPSDPVAAHVTPAGFDRTLSEERSAAIRRGYKDDIALFQACLEMRQAIMSRPS